MNDGILLIFLAIILALPILQIVRQNKNMKTIEKFRKNLQPGMKVETAGGLRGVVSSVDDQTVRLVIAPGVEVDWSLQGILRPAPDHGTGTASYGSAAQGPAYSQGPEGRESAQRDRLEEAGATEFGTNGIGGAREAGEAGLNGESGEKEADGKQNK